MQIIIVAGGQGKRLYTESLETQKPLFCYNNKPIIAHLIDLYKNYSNDITVVLIDNYLGRLTEAWLKDFYKNAKWLNIDYQTNSPGTTNALLSTTIKPGKKLISWADFVIDKNDFDIMMSSLDKTTFIVSDIECRFGIEDNKIVNKKSNPGFIGMYYFEDNIILNKTDGDFIENYLGEEVNTTNLNVKNLGTISELVQLNAFKKSSNRFFNKVEFDGDFVYKTALDENAIKLQKNEVNWYENAPNELKPHLPKCNYFSDKNLLILEKLKAKPISELSLTKDFWRKDLPDLLSKLHVGEFAVDKNSCDDVYINKPKQRLSEVKNTINCWFKDNKKINGEVFEDYNIPNDLYPKHFTFIHGDLQFSNSMLGEKLYLIDPRGYFGETKLYGDTAYDIAKILYALDAYHKINEGKFSVHKNVESTFLIHHSEKLNSDQIYFFELVCDKYEISKEKLNYLLHSIWISLTSYIIDNPTAIIAAYCKAMIRTKYKLLG